MSPSPQIECVAQTGSTNADLLERLGNGTPIEEGYWLRAERQSGGRGRLGRRWDSPAGNLYCSTIVNLREDDSPAHSLSLVAGLASFDCLERSLAPGSDIALKWPNDALVRGAKIAGILLERSSDSVVVGIGVNIRHAPDLQDRQTTSILRENGAYAESAEMVLSILAERFAIRLNRWRTEPLAATLDAWTDAAHPIGSSLSVGGEDERVTGTFAGLNQNGALMLRLADGAVRTIHAGDVSLMAER